MQYRREIDGLRAIAVVPVILFHAGYEHFSGGYVGVDVFFVISGYLITSILLKEMAEESFSLLNFYERRARRILPALFFVLFCSIPAAWFLFLQADMERFAWSILSVVTFSSNYFFYSESGYFDIEAELKPLLHTWSLAVEEQFYIFFPLLLMGMWRFGARAIIWVLTAIFLLSLALAHWGAYEKPEAAFYFLLTRAWELLIGAFAAYYMLKHGTGVARGWMNAVSVVGLAAIVLSVFAYDADTPFPSLYALVPTLGAVAVILFARSGTMVHWLLSRPLLVWAGLLSYSLYLWHQPLLAFGRKYLMEDFDRWVPMLLALTALLSVVTYFSVERPFRVSVPTRGVVLGTIVSTILAVALATSALMMPHYSVFANVSPEWRETQNVLTENTKARGRAIRQDVCHFTGRTGITAESYLDNWSCYDLGTRDDAVSVPIAVAGDSNAADIANAFRENGLNPANMSGAGCNLAPLLMQDHCRIMFERFIEILNNDGRYRVLVLTNLYTAREYKPDAIAETAEFWSAFDGYVVILLDTPRFHNHFEKLRYGFEPKIDLSFKGLKISEAEISTLKAAGFSVYSRNDLYCAINECGYRDADGRILISEARGEHLTLRGAQLFGEKLLEALAKDGIWQRGELR